MRRNWTIIFSVLLLIGVNSCNHNDVDTEKPQIENSFIGAFPVNCDTIYFGETFELKVTFTDNIALGSYSVDIHNNFNHHSHSTEIKICIPDADKDPLNPFLLIDEFSIPDGKTEVQTSLSIEIPAQNDTDLYDEGDYHFYIRLSDKEGWSTQKGLSIKMLHR